MTTVTPAIEIGGETIRPGEQKLVSIPVANLSNQMPVTLPIHVIHGRAPGPTAFVCAALHGDELSGVEVIRRLLRIPELDALAGTLLCVPVVNGYGFISRSRYLPDRRDLNRSFPGASRGSLGAQLAHIFMAEVVARSDFGIDLHTAAVHRTNLPQIRSRFLTPRARALARAFGAPVMLFSDERPGSLRQAASDKGIDVLVYEGGEGLRLDELSVRAGVRGVLGCLAHEQMISLSDDVTSDVSPVFARSSKWTRAPESGVVRTLKTIGDRVEEDEVLALIASPYGGGEFEVEAAFDGIVIGRTNLPVVNLGDALFHIANVRAPEDAEAVVSDHARELEGDPVFDEDEII
ncbi:MAG: succinylglutamate desuccinylase/aspartoacylase family protein [Pseudomonadota bacterium]